MRKSFTSPSGFDWEMRPHLCEAADIIVLLSFSLLFVVILLLLLLLFALWWLYRSYWKSQIISRGSLSLGCLWKTGRETEQKENRSVWKIRSRKLRRHEEDNDVKSRCIQVRRKPLGSTRIHEWKIWTASFKVKHVGCKKCLQTEFSICTRVKYISALSIFTKVNTEAKCKIMITCRWFWICLIIPFCSFLACKPRTCKVKTCEMKKMPLK